MKSILRNNFQIDKYCPKAKRLLVGTKLDLWMKDDFVERSISQNFIDEIANQIGK